MGNIRRAAESSAVGSECVIWSHVHKSWCRAQTLKISDDSTLVSTSFTVNISYEFFFLNLFIACTLVYKFYVHIGTAFGP